MFSSQALGGPFGVRAMLGKPLDVEVLQSFVNRIAVIPEVPLWRLAIQLIFG